MLQSRHFLRPVKMPVLIFIYKNLRMSDRPIFYAKFYCWLEDNKLIIKTAAGFANDKKQAELVFIKMANKWPDIHKYKIVQIRHYPFNLKKFLVRVLVKNGQSKNFVNLIIQAENRSEAELFVKQIISIWNNVNDFLIVKIEQIQYKNILKS